MSMPPELPPIGALLDGSPIKDAVPEALGRLIRALGAEAGAIFLHDDRDRLQGWAWQGVAEVPPSWSQLAQRATREGRRVEAEGLAAVPLPAGAATLGAVLVSPGGDPPRLEHEAILLALGLEARHKMAQLTEFDRLKGDFVSMVSHELRTPITTIKGCLDSIERGYASTRESRDQLIAMARKNTERLNRIVEDLLDVSRLENRQMVLRFASLDVEPVVRGLVQSFEASARERDIRLEMTVDADLAPIWADEDRTFQALANLVNNAIKFSRPGGHVRISAEALGDKVWVRVADSGPGIAPDDRQAVFDRFSQVDSSASRRHGGAGLGLYITREAVLAMKGQITVDPGPRSGTVFSVGLPIARRVTLPPRDGRDVLVVDDDETFVEFLRIILGREGYQVHCASTGLEGLKAAVRHQPSLILLDLMMPDLDGWGLLDYLQEGEATRSIPVMILSALRPDAEARRFRSYPYLEKSIHPKALLGAIRNVLPPPSPRAVQ